MKGLKAPFLIALLLVCSLAGQLFAAAPSAASQKVINDILALIDANRPEDALEMAKRALATEPGLVEAHYLYIQLMIELGRQAEVQAQYAKIKESNQSGLALMLYGRTLASLDEMEKTCRQSLALDPKLGWGYYCVATVQMRRNQVTPAVDSLKEAIKIQPDFYQGMQSLAGLYLALDRRDEAIAMYEKVLAINSSDAQTLYQLGSLLGRKGDTAKAVSLLEKSYALAPDNPQVMSNLAFLYFKLQRYDEALSLYDKALAAKPDQPDVDLNREIVARVRQGKLAYETVAEMEKAMDAKSPDEAIAHYRTALAKNPDFELAYLALGQMLVVTGRQAEAEKAFLEAVRLNPSMTESVRMLAELYIVMRQPQKAEPVLKEAISRQPKAAELYAALGNVYLSVGKAIEAEKSFSTAVSLLDDRRALPSRVNRARAIAAQGRLSDAAAELRAVLKIAPSMDSARLELGHCYFAMEDFDRARVEYKVLLTKAPDNQELQALLDAVNDTQQDYQAKSKTYLRARHIVVKTRPEAEEILKALQGGANFEALATQKSIGPEAARGGDIGFFKPGELNSDFEKAVLALKVGQVSGIVQTPMGFHIIKRLN